MFVVVDAVDANVAVVQLFMVVDVVDGLDANVGADV